MLELLHEAPAEMLRELDIRGNHYTQDVWSAIIQTREDFAAKRGYFKLKSNAPFHKQVPRGSRLHTWDEARVVAWLKSVSPFFETYGEAFKENMINGDVLLTLTGNT